MGTCLAPNNPKAEKSNNGNNILRSKEFVERNSLIDDLMKNKHIVTLYHMFLAIIFGLILHTAAYEYIYKGKINFGQNLVIKGLRNLHIFIILWIGLCLVNFLIYYGFKYWATVRTNLPPKSLKIKLWDSMWLCLIIAYYPGWLYFTTKISLAQDLPMFFGFATFCEITRMLMKMHSFVRSNVPRVLKYKQHAEDDVLHPELSQFIYFLWVPTLIYSDHYPRSKTIRWSYVATKLAEFIAAILWISVLVERYIIINFKDYGTKPYSWQEIVVTTIGNVGAGMMLMLCLFYTKLHIWMGAFAEVSRFADRMFYADWWTSINHERYYRTWNVLIHDWLYTYIYKDFYESIVPGNKIVAKVVVFFISAIFHEYILACSVGFFMPVLFFLFFICGTIMTFIQLKPDVLANTFILYTIGLGCSIGMSVFGMEYYARQNCPIENPSIYTYIVPRLFSCGVH